MDKISRNFSLQELIKSQTAIRKNINNNPAKEHLENLHHLVHNVLQPIRDVLGPTIISSGYRSYDLNVAIGGSQNSQHSKGQAADIEVIGQSNYDLALYIKNNLEFDQLILEFAKENDSEAGWVHVSYNKDKNRNQVLSAIKLNGETKYVSGLEFS